MVKNVRKGIIREGNDLESGFITGRTELFSTKKYSGTGNPFPRNTVMMILNN
jgi:hypothetical protein